MRELAVARPKRQFPRSDTSACFHATSRDLVVEVASAQLQLKTLGANDSGQRSSGATNLADLKYRPDIDGLRAVAVLSVVLFHVDKHWAPGGFIGVDIFFVISGFLITGNIVRAIEDGSFSLAQFYRRRIQRIAPVLFVVILATLVAGQFMMIPTDLSRLAESAVASQLSVANIYFTYFLDTSYFAADSNLEPLLHIWSLGVEEQFYLFWPLLLMLVLGRWSARWMPLWILAGIAASFAFAEWVIDLDPMFAYYMLPSRAGQLLAGALCFFLMHRGAHRRLGVVAVNGLSLLGLLLVGGSLALLDEAFRFPGWNAIPVTAGAALLIFAGSREKSIVNRALEIKPAVAIGLISYSLYLWHWPVLAFARYAYGELSLNQELLCLVVMFALSYLSFRFVEKPFRRRKGSPFNIALRQLGIPSAIVVAVAAVFIASGGFGAYAFSGSYRAALASISNDIEPASQSPFVCQFSTVTRDNVRDPRCILGSKLEPHVLLWGDSHAAHFVGAVGEMAHSVGFAFRNVAHSGCPPVLDEPENFVASTQVKDCRSSGEVVRDILPRYDGVILAGVWGAYVEADEDFLETLDRTLETLVNQGKTVLILGDIPPMPALDRECEMKALKLPFLNCRKGMTVRRASKAGEINKKIQAIAINRGASYFDFNDFLCNKSRCSPYVEEKIVYYNPSHLTTEGSILIGSIAKSRPEAVAAFKPLVGPDVNTVDLPWNTVIPDLSDPKEKILISDNLIEVAAWAGKYPLEAAASGGLHFSEDSPDQYVAWTARLGDAAMSALQTAAATDVLYIEMTLRAEKGGRPMLKVVGDGPTPAVFDFGLVPSLGTVKIVRASGPVRATAAPGPGGTEFKIAVPIKDLGKHPRISFLPAAGDSKKPYSKQSIGSVIMTDMRVYLAKPVDGTITQ